MRVMNLAQSSPPLTVEVVPSEAAELLMSIVAIADVVDGSHDLDSYDMGEETLRRIYASVDESLLADVRSLTSGCGKLAANLLGFVYSSPPPRGVKELLATLGVADPLDVYLQLLDYNVSRKRWRASMKELVERAATGDKRAKMELVEGLKRADKSGLERQFERILALGKEGAKELLVATLSRWNDEVFTAFGADWHGSLKRDAKAKLELLASVTPERAIELATNGVQFVPEPGIDRVVLFPTYVLRPWVLISEDEDTKIFCYPVADDSLGIDASEPPPQLVKLYKALGDTSRLRLLRRLMGGSMSLKEATELLGSAKSTAYHHLAILRQAGLVWVREDEEHTYSLRDDLIPQASELLDGYLGR